MPQHHLIVGGCGFIGRHVAVRLASNGERVTLADLVAPSFDMPPDASRNITWREMDESAPDWDALVADVDVVHAYAWSSLPATANADPGSDLARNVVPLIGLLDALARRGSGRVVFTSSGGTVYGVIRTFPITEDHPTAPITGYGAGKASAETYLRLYRAMHGLDCRIARISNPYGAGQNVSRGLGAVMTFLHSALEHRPVTIFGDGEIIRDYIHISDVATCLARLATAPRDDEFIFNVGSGVGTSLNALVSAVGEVSGRSLVVERMARRGFDVPANVLSIDRVGAVYGWRPRLSLADGLQQTLADLGSGRRF